MFSILGGKLKSVLLGSIGILSIALSFVFALLQKEKKERIEQELEDEKATSELSDKVTAAIVEASVNENTKVKRNKHKFIDFS